MNENFAGPIPIPVNDIMFRKKLLYILMDYLLTLLSSTGSYIII